MSLNPITKNKLQTENAIKYTEDRIKFYEEKMKNQDIDVTTLSDYQFDMFEETMKLSTKYENKVLDDKKIKVFDECGIACNNYMTQIVEDLNNNKDPNEADYKKLRPSSFEYSVKSIVETYTTDITPIISNPSIIYPRIKTAIEKDQESRDWKNKYMGKLDTILNKLNIIYETDVEISDYKKLNFKDETDAQNYFNDLRTKIENTFNDELGSNISKREVEKVYSGFVEMYDLNILGDINYDSETDFNIWKETFRLQTIFLERSLKEARIDNSVLINFDEEQKEYFKQKINSIAQNVGNTPAPKKKKSSKPKKKSAKYDKIFGTHPWSAGTVLEQIKKFNFVLEDLLLENDDEKTKLLDTYALRYTKLKTVQKDRVGSYELKMYGDHIRIEINEEGIGEAVDRYKDEFNFFSFIKEGGIPQHSYGQLFCGDFKLKDTIHAFNSIKDMYFDMYLPLRNSGIVSLEDIGQIVRVSLTPNEHGNKKRSIQELKQFPGLDYEKKAEERMLPHSIELENLYTKYNIKPGKYQDLTKINHEYFTIKLKSKLDKDTKEVMNYIKFVLEILESTFYAQNVYEQITGNDFKKNINFDLPILRN